ncbi:MAG: SDR family oxidoreductase [Actinomycetota bacterium]|nr:SDR family oxidoreductase [Actinomycetota bacterium]
MAIFRKRPERIRGIAGSLDGKTILVADGATGSGPGIVRVLSEAGARVAFTGPSAVHVDLQLRALANTPHEVAGTVTTVDTDSERRRLITSTASPLDALVINVADPGNAREGPDRDAAAPAAGQLTPQSAVALVQLAVGKMKDGGREGAVVFITGIDRAGPTAPTVATLTSEMEQLARRVAPNGIRVNAVAPGQVASNRRGHVVSSRVAPLGHVSIHPIEVGKAVWFLINDDLSGGITGTTLKTDRGASLLRPEW